MNQKRKPINKNAIFTKKIEIQLFFHAPKTKKGDFGSEMNEQHILILLQGNESEWELN